MTLAVRDQTKHTSTALTKSYHCLTFRNRSPLPARREIASIGGDGVESNSPTEGTQEQRQLPEIKVNDRPLRSVGQQALAALTRRNDGLAVPRLYVRGGEPVRVKRDEGGKLRIQDLTPDLVLYELTRAANFYREPMDGPRTEVFPPRDVARYVLSATGWAMPGLSGITTIPTFRPDGSILDSRGYDPATGHIYDPPAGFEVAVPDNPAKKDVRAALALVDEWIGQFPYADAASLANTLALALTLVLREVITGPVPLAAIDKPSPGTGATLLVESLAVATSGAEPGALGVTNDDNETRKQITAKLRTGERWLFLDNVAVELKSASLARALTATEWEDRILGVSKTARVPQRAVWVATGNNLTLSLEIARRCYWIRLDAEVPRPWERDPERFEHPDLKDWTRDNRARILSALLTIGRRWFAQGKPVPDDAPSLGSFESWSRTLAGVLHAAGVAGFLANSGQLYERASEDPGSWEAFLDAWRTGYGAERVAARKIAEDLYEEDYAALRQALPDEFGLLDENIRDKNLAKRLGRAFAKREGVPYGPRKLHLARRDRKPGGSVDRAPGQRPEAGYGESHEFCEFFTVTSSRACGRGSEA
jgi:putative DNA primase/helicase